MLYAAVRVAWHYLQESLIRLRDTSLVLPFTNQKRVEDLIESVSEKSSNPQSVSPTILKPLELSNLIKPTSFATLLGNLVFYSSYSRPGGVAMLGWCTLIIFLFIIGPFIALTIVKVPLSIFIFLPYFLSGVMTAFLAEMYFYHFSLFKATYSQLPSDSVSAVTASRRSNVNSSVSDGEGDIEIGNITRGFFNAYLPVLTSDCENRSRRPHRDGVLSSLGAYLWRFFPDMIAFVFVIFLTTAGDLSYRPFQRTLEWTILPMMSIVYLIVATIQDDWARNNLSRWLLQTGFMNWFGYISYPMFLFQKSLLNWWAPKIAECFNLNKFVLFTRGNPAFGADTNEATWFTNLNMGYRIIGFFVLCCFCWLVQKYYQDTFVMWVFKKYMERMRNPRVFSFCGR